MVAIFVAFITSEFTRRREARKQIEDYLRLLNAARAELILLRGIVKIARDHTASSLNGLTAAGAKNIFHPSYSFDPSYFEKLKFELARSRVKAPLMHRIGWSHFEFQHLRERFAAAKAALAEVDLETLNQNELSPVLVRLGGFIQLVDQDLPGLDAGESELNAEIKSVEVELREFAMTPPFTPY